jgi:hypothetical protein
VVAAEFIFAIVGRGISTLVVECGWVDVASATDAVLVLVVFSAVLVEDPGAGSCTSSVQTLGNGSLRPGTITHASLFEPESAM